MRVAVVGGGPAGLFLARMAGLSRPDAAVTVYERGGPEDVFGFGVTLSDRTLAQLETHDPVTHREILAASAQLTGVQVRLAGRRLRYPGFGAAAISRHALLRILRERASEAGARIRYHRRVRPGDLDADVIAVADGARSEFRDANPAFGTRKRTGVARYVWLGTAATFGDAATLVFERTAHGPMAAHCYSYGDGMSTVVVELAEDTWRAAGLDDGREVDGDAPPLLTDVFAEHLGGHKLVGNHSRWGRFTVVRNDSWSAGRTVLLGDAAHTAHFTVSSGTKLALEDAIALGRALGEHDDHAGAFAAYERQRRPVITRTQQLAEPSMRWWETYGSRLDRPPAQFGLHFLTRTGALSTASLRRRCGASIDEAAAEFAGGARDVFAVPLRLPAARLATRVVRAERDVLRDADGNAVPCAEVSTVDEAVACGRPAVLVRRDSWDDAVRVADEIRTGTGAAVAVPADAAGEDAALALVAGRIDLVAVRTP